MESRSFNSRRGSIWGLARNRNTPAKHQELKLMSRVIVVSYLLGRNIPFFTKEFEELYVAFPWVFSCNALIYDRMKEKLRANSLRILVLV